MITIQRFVLLTVIFTVNCDDGENSTKNDETNWFKFPKGFIIGAATAAHQIEGAWNVSGKGVSVWDNFAHTNSSRINNNSNADIACDSYNKYKEDVAILKQLGFDAYRFSVSWTRILPTGFTNLVNQDGLAYYHSLLDELLANNIEPIVTMVHWDHPQIIEDLGGWTNEMIVDWFGDYARVLYHEFGGKVKKWITLNEPEAACLYGYSVGLDAPGKTVHGIAEYLCAHNALKAHARAYRIYQNEFKSLQNGTVGITVNMKYFYPKNPEADDTAAEIAFQFGNGWLMHPIFSNKGDYPDMLKDVVAQISKDQKYPRSRLPVFTKEWIDYIRGSADFLGINHYTSFLVEPGIAGVEPSFYRDRGLVRSSDPSWKRAASSWLNIVPRGFGDLLRKLASEYRNPTIYVYENGMSDTGEIDDLSRIQYYHDYLQEMLIAINRDCINVKGYFVWSLLDNFEWNHGYSECFGIVKVDFSNPNRTRTLKQSAYWWKRVLESRNLEPATMKNDS